MHVKGSRDVIRGRLWPTTTSAFVTNPCPRPAFPVTALLPVGTYDAPAWEEAGRCPGPHRDDPDRIWRTFEAPAPCEDGYRVIWVHSSAKAARDGASRAARIQAGLAAVEAVAAHLGSPKTRLKTRVAADDAATAALAQAGASRWVGFTVAQSTQETYRQENRGRPGASTRYRRTEGPLFTITATVDTHAVTYDAATDGCFPLVTNDPDMTPPKSWPPTATNPTSNDATTS